MRCQHCKVLKEKAQKTQHDERLGMRVGLHLLYRLKLALQVGSLLRSVRASRAALQHRYRRIILRLQ